MADNVTANAGAGGATFVTASFDWSGDTAHATGCFVGLLSGAEGTWSFVQLVGGAGAVTAGTQRMTLASDDPAVSKLTTIDADTGAIATSLASLDAKVTACNTGSVVIASGSVAVTNAGTFAVQAAQSGTWNIGTLASITNPVTIQDGGNTITVDGTIAATQSGTWSVRAQDGSGNALTSAARGSERALSVQIVDASGNQVTSFGGSGGGDGAILDGVSSSVKATVRDYANANPLAVSLTDATGDAITTLPVSLASAVAVTGTFWQATQPISAAALPLPAGAATDATLTAIAGYLDTEIASGVSYLSTLAGAVSAGHLQVDVLTAPTTTVSGTVAATQSGTWTVQPGNTANTTAWLVTGTGGTFPITAASLPLPSGAATSALQGGGLPAALGAGGGLKVDGSGTALPVSGTVTVQDGGGAITVDGTLAVSSVGGSVAVTGTFWQATQPVSLASVPSHEVTNAGTFAVQAAQSGTWNITNVSGTVSLPTGAATAAKQPALGTAGTPSADVITVQGIASMTALKVDGSAVTQPVSGTVTANAGTNLNTSALALESGGNLAAIATDAAAIEVLLGTIDGDTSALAGCVGGTELQVDVASSALPTGAATEATLGDIKTSVQLIDNAISGAGFNITQLAGAAVPIGAGTETAALRVTVATDSTGTLSVDDGGGALTVDGTVAATQSGTWNVATVTTVTTCSTVTNILQLGGQAISMGTGLRDAGTQRVTIATDDVVPASQSGTWNIGTVTAVTAISNALPAGTNAIGKLAANSGVDIGDVDITSIVSGTGATNLGKAEDAGHTSGDVGVMALAVRQDAAAALAGTDADYAPLEVDAIGRLHTNNTEVSGYVYDGATLCTVKRFHVVTSTNGADLIAAVASKKFRILSFGIFSISSTITRFWLEDSDGTDIFGSSTGIPLEEDSGAAPPGFVLNRNLDGWFQTPAANKDLHIGLTAAQTVVVIGTYIEVA